MQGSLFAGKRRKPYDAVDGAIEQVASGDMRSTCRIAAPYLLFLMRNERWKSPGAAKKIHNQRLIWWKSCASIPFVRELRRGREFDGLRCWYRCVFQPFAAGFFPASGCAQTVRRPAPLFFGIPRASALSDISRFRHAVFAGLPLFQRVSFPCFKP